MGLEVFFLTCARGDSARWFPASVGHSRAVSCAPRRYPCEASRTRRAAADNRACGDGVGMEEVRGVGSIAVAMITFDWGCTHGLKKLRMLTNPPLRSNALLIFDIFGRVQWENTIS